MEKKKVGTKLRELRLQAGLSQKQVYEILGVSQSTFSSWEVGKSEPDAITFLKLCKIYNIDDILLEFTGQTTNQTFSSREIFIIKKFRQLNDTGKTKLEEYLSDLEDNSKYTVETSAAIDKRQAV